VITRRSSSVDYRSPGPGLVARALRVETTGVQHLVTGALRPTLPDYTMGGVVVDLDVRYSADGWAHLAQACEVRAGVALAEAGPMSTSASSTRVGRSPISSAPRGALHAGRDHQGRDERPVGATGVEQHAPAVVPEAGEAERDPLDALDRLVGPDGSPPCPYTWPVRDVDALAADLHPWGLGVTPQRQLIYSLLSETPSQPMSRAMSHQKETPREEDRRV
jgi:hypothetical protein